ncbi:hypothetical protein FIU54_09805 [Enterococcus faecium]|nr:hypothetical protein [Enterococcus faecium]MBO1092897.1 hypothetical protein [Enterococcus lactis]PCE12007.1 hypothetical protein CKY17_07430 [Enterococcus faecium]PHL12244.1 hypothetical protein CQR40_11345 [Enterococcus faecium]TNX04645.1 hypothetical protein FIU54_09805 [Enterococcus faecium]
MGLLPQMQAFEHRLFEKRSCDKTFVTAPYYYLTMDKRNEVLYYLSIFSKATTLLSGLSSWNG